MDARTLDRRYHELRNEVQSLRASNLHLEQELRALRPYAYRSDQKIDRLEQANARLKAENLSLRRKLKDLSSQLKQKPRRVPPFVKANVPEGSGKKRPGRKRGHEAAVRPRPGKIDRHVTLEVPIDVSGKPSCPACNTQLSGVKRHERIVEDLIPQQVVTTCYHTTSGYCPSCRKVIETRAPEQPPAADLPHGQLGLNALSTAAVMRVCYRLPYRQITKLFGQLPGLAISPGAIVRQIKRLGKWLQKQYHRLKLALRLAGVVHADETGWRTNGKNGYLWTLTNADHTLYAVDSSRSRRVIVELLGEAFGQTSDQTLVSDFYGVYDGIDAPQQKCLTHLLRELKETATRRPELAKHAFFVECKRLTRAMLKLKKNQPTMAAEASASAVRRLENRLDALIARTWNDPDADRLTQRLAKHRQSLTTFLHKPEVDGTNNAAERALRPAVVMRKITGGSRSKEGANAWSILASVMRTAEQQGKDVLDCVKTLLKAEWAGEEVPSILTDSS
jgi:transposase